MKIGEIIGVVWSTKKVHELNGCQLHIVQPKTTKNEDFGTPIVVADPNNIGTVGDLVVYVTSTDATQVFKNGYSPVNASVVELVDEIS